MTVLRAIPLLLLVALGVQGQTATLPQHEFYAAGAAYQSASSPHVTGWGAYADCLGTCTLGLYSYTEYDVIPKSTKPLILQSSIRTGFAHREFSSGLFSAYICGDAGASVDATGAGVSWGGCGVGVLRFGKTKWSLVAMVSGVKNSLSDPTAVFKLGVGRIR